MCAYEFYAHAPSRHCIPLRDLHSIPARAPCALLICMKWTKKTKKKVNECKNKRKRKWTIKLNECCRLHRTREIEQKFNYSISFSLVMRANIALLCNDLKKKKNYTRSAIFCHTFFPCWKWKSNNWKSAAFQSSFHAYKLQRAQNNMDCGRSGQSRVDRTRT